jgi:hypothetical protein
MERDWTQSFRATGSNSHYGLKQYGLGIVMSSSQKKTSRNDATAQRKAALRCAVAPLRETFCCCFGAEMPELPRVYAKLRIAGRQGVSFHSRMQLKEKKRHIATQIFRHPKMQKGRGIAPPS